MKKTLAIGLAILSGGVAQAEISLSTDITFGSEYVFRGVQLGDNTIHPSIEVKSDNFYIGYWGADPIDHRSSEGWDDEIDIYAGYGIDLSDTVSLDLGATHYYYPHADSSTEFYVGANLKAGAFTPGLYLYYDIDLEVFTAQANVGFSLPMENLGTSLDLSAYLGNADPDQGESYSYYGIDAVVPFKINENATVNVGAHYAHNNITGIDRNHFYFTGGVTLGF